MARVLVTGGAGFIGSHLVAALVARGDDVRVLDNFSTGSAANLAGLEGRIDVHEGDLRDPARVAAAVEGVETILHEAAFVSVPQSLEAPADCYATNVDGSIHLLEAARRAGVARVVLASSAAVYGNVSQMPLSEAGPTESLSPYAASKYMSETLAGLYTAAYGLPVTALRYFNVYGPRQSPDSAYAAAIPRFIQRLAAGQPPTVFGDGTQTRDFIFVGDVVRANLLAAEAPTAAGRAINVCSGAETSLRDLLDGLYGFFSDAPGAEFAAPRAGDVPRSLGDPTLAAELLGFRAEVSLQDGLRQCVQGAPA
ncbi:MAG: NAD-dependent epimerase/dehydratase family protein [Anaerolineales bacterium]|nr:NAD-dependent epimerase/dehydratase family protein [Anaerolineales bacterium]